MKKRKTSLQFALICLLIVGLLSACAGVNNAGNGDKGGKQGAANGDSNANNTAEPEADVYAENGLPKDEKVTLKFAYWENGGGREWIDYAIETFTAKFPNVSFDVTYSPTIETIIATKIAANNDQDMYDIFSTSIAGEGIHQSLAEAKKIEPQDDLWDRKAYDSDKTLRELQSGVNEGSGRIEGIMYSLPTTQSITGLFYDKNRFEEKGWNQNPRTWTEFVALVDEIKAAGLTPITYPGKYPGYLNFSFGLAQQYSLAEANGKLDDFNDTYRNYKHPYFTREETKQLYQNIYELGKKGAFPNGVAALTHTQSQMQLLQGQAAMASTGEWVQNEMKESTPDGFKWGFMLVPMTENPDDVKYHMSYTQGGHYIWSAKPELNKQWAKEFLVWLWNLDVQSLVAEKAGSLPVRNDFMNSPELVDKLQDAPKAIMEYMKNNQVKGVSFARDTVFTDINAERANTIVAEMLNDVALGRLDPSATLQEADDLLKKAIESAQ
ncbi:ABC transporter substrate-binding protein [Paenibacillus sp. GCM10027626]|uniref:ABC transporter substrate-binding protein n=1 Tax=Paenibacillus sp. GCM10027626 TaxID=3273411 RepID=UPI003626AAA5